MSDPELTYTNFEYRKQSYHHRFNGCIYFRFKSVICYQDREKMTTMVANGSIDQDKKWIDILNDGQLITNTEFFLLYPRHTRTHLMIDRWTKTIHTQTRTVEFFSSLVWHNCLFEFAIYLDWNRYPGNIKANSVNVMNSYYFYHLKNLFILSLTVQ